MCRAHVVSQVRARARRASCCLWRGYATRCRRAARQENVAADGLRATAHPPAGDATRRGAALNRRPKGHHPPLIHHR